MFTISQFAKAANVNVETIRFYERKGLLEQPIKPSQGYRKYSEQALASVVFIKRAQKLGFTLTEIASLLVLSATSCDDVQHLAENKLEIIDDKIKDLINLKDSLVGLISACKSNPTNEKCPIINSLQPQFFQHTY
jgi:MerR family mercuric resistance operon transcriptional regulator